MVRRMNLPVTRRPSLPLTARDEVELEALRRSPELRRALAAIAPMHPEIEGDVSEGVLLHAVLQAGLVAVRGRAEDDGYAALAEEYADASGTRRRMSRRRKPGWAQEP